MSAQIIWRYTKDSGSGPATAVEIPSPLACAKKNWKCHFWYPKNCKNSNFGGTKNGTSGARIKILRPLFNTN